MPIHSKTSPTTPRGSGCYVHVAEDGETARERWRPYLTGYVSPAEAKDRVHEVKTVVEPDIHLAVFDVDALPHDVLVDNMGMFPADVMPER
ncbi:hypothetical protein DEU38_105250 [Rhodococcus sp. AG1013]|uniref:hypothetical protein n=1 Tax=Rhodococcus sp. AG1013 TaxID=2183996 RepID=UPI000E2C04DF|nr:hypothetical protein [Rhodococcus sp. AG1013]RDI30665.1 hypothetical protein DEU38_105250 [Rhodococcus sp. AG1013]